MVLANMCLILPRVPYKKKGGASFTTIVGMNTQDTGDRTGTQTKAQANSIAASNALYHPTLTHMWKPNPI